MARKILIALTTAAGGAAVTLLALLLLGRGNLAVAQAPGENPGARARALASQPDTSSPNWKFLSDDVGVMIRQDDSLGLRGRLYVRKDGIWLPVATDGPADTNRAVPIS
jgi:hypothetical protein